MTTLDMEMHMGAKHLAPKHTEAAPVDSDGVDGRVAKRSVSRPTGCRPAVEGFDFYFHKLGWIEPIDRSTRESGV